MKNNTKFLIIFFLKVFLTFNLLSASEQFNFDVTEVEITDEGNIFNGLKRGTATTDDGMKITADRFVYNKALNILNAYGNVRMDDIINDYVIFSEKITYLKNEEKIFTIGKTAAVIESNYNFKSKNVLFLKNEMKLSSLEKTTILDNEFTLYKFDSFEYLLNEKLLKANNVEIITNYNKTEKLNNEEEELISISDHYKLDNAIFNFTDKSFIASDTKINIQKNIFGMPENDPRIIGVSSKNENNITTVNKGVFTSCGLNDTCPPWSIKASKIKHDKNKKRLIYDNAILKVYNVPVFYFPKFFHPDPSVKRQSGFLQPQLNNSEALGSSLLTPYFYVISDSKDVTIKPTFFDSDKYMFQNEYRQANKNSSFIADLGLTTGYKSREEKLNKENSIGHLFSEFNLDLDLENFITSEFDISIQKVTNDTYLKVFESNLIDTELKPSNQNKLTTSIALTLDHEESYKFDAGMTAYESLSGLNSDRFQFILPYYNLSKNLLNNQYGQMDFTSAGTNNLTDTNKSLSKVNNDLNITSVDFISNYGFKNNFGIYFKNINRVAKNHDVYESSPQSEFANIYNFESSFPLTKITAKYFNSITPKISFRINPGDMDDMNAVGRMVDTDNVFSINRLGVTDSFEQGKSLTFGIDYKKEAIDDLNRYFEFNLATVYRDTKQNKIPTTSTIGSTNSNIFGKSAYHFSDKVKVDYKFAIDNDLQTFEYNSLQPTLDLNNFITSFNFIEENGKMGETNLVESTTTLKFNEDNYLTYKTRRNRKISLTEYHDLVYEYKNDCLVAGLKYKKTYYQDRDLLPSEDLFLTITLFPLTQYEQKVNKTVWRDEDENRFKFGN